MKFRVDEKEYECILKKVQLSGKRNMASYLRYIAEARGYSVSELEAVRIEKAEKRGGFRDKIYLEYVEDGNE